MTNLKQVKHQLKTNNLLKEYNLKFAHKQMKFLCSKIAIIFKEDIDVDTLYSLETSVLKSKLNKDIYAEAMNILKNKISKKVDWKSLGAYLWFQLQTSTYYKDAKNKIKNTYNESNYIKLNSDKRDAWQDFIDSLENNYTHFNLLVIAILKVSS